MVVLVIGYFVIFRMATCILDMVCSLWAFNHLISHIKTCHEDLGEYQIL